MFMLLYDSAESFSGHDKCGDAAGPAARLAAEVILQPTELFMDKIKAEMDDLAEARKRKKG